MTDHLQDIREGMAVKDSGGHHIGTVDRIKFTDEVPGTGQAEQITADIVTQTERTFVDDLIASFRVDEVPEELHQELLRKGFIRIDSDGLFAADRYILPEQIAGVNGDDVTLKVDKDDLIKRH